MNNAFDKLSCVLNFLMLADSNTPPKYTGTLAMYAGILISEVHCKVMNVIGTCRSSMLTLTAHMGHTLSSGADDSRSL